MIGNLRLPLSKRSRRSGHFNAKIASVLLSQVPMLKPHQPARRGCRAQSCSIFQAQSRPKPTGRLSLAPASQRPQSLASYSLRGRPKGMRGTLYRRGGPVAGVRRIGRAVNFGAINFIALFVATPAEAIVAWRRGFGRSRRGNFQSCLATR